MNSPYASSTLSPRSPRSHGFTLVELLVVITVIAILAALLLPVISRAKSKAKETDCMNNLRNLGLAFSMYRDDNKDHFPAPGSNRYGAQPEDWLHWQEVRDPAQSSIVPYLGGYQESYFVCPTERRSVRYTESPNVSGGRYIYSYSFTSHDLMDDVNPGMSTLITGEESVYYFSFSEVHNPSAKIMLVDEDRGTIDDSRWVPRSRQYHHNLITKRHNEEGNVTFADGHVERVDPSMGADPYHTMPAFSEADVRRSEN